LFTAAAAPLPAAELDDSGSLPNTIVAPAGAAAAAAAATAGGWSELRPGVLQQQGSTLEWTARDNGEKIGGLAARDYCARLKFDGGRWRLPVLDELRPVFIGAPSSLPCGKFMCNVSPLFQLSGNFLWSGSTADPGMFPHYWYLGLSDGNVEERDAQIGSRGGLRALCVRST
jgi:hypothetical protein